MKEFKVKFSVNGRQTEQVVSATGANEARKIIESQYSGSNVMIINVQDTSTGFYG